MTEMALSSDIKAIASARAKLDAMLSQGGLLADQFTMQERAALAAALTDAMTEARQFAGRKALAEIEAEREARTESETAEGFESAMDELQAERERELAAEQRSAARIGREINGMLYGR